MTQLWEILVPTIHPATGKPIRTRYHRVWDTKVKAITGGLTIMPVAKGYWKDTPQERMIPVRIVGTREQMNEIGPMTCRYYGQEEVLAYKVSTEVVFYKKGETLCTGKLTNAPSRKP